MTISGCFVINTISVGNRKLCFKLAVTCQFVQQWWFMHIYIFYIYIHIYIYIYIYIYILCVHMFICRYMYFYVCVCFFCLYVSWWQYSRVTWRLPFQWVQHRGVGESATPFPGLLHFTLDMHLILLSVKQGCIKYHFKSLWYDTTWDWTQVSWIIGVGIIIIIIMLHFTSFSHFHRSPSNS